MIRLYSRANVLPFVPRCFSVCRLVVTVLCVDPCIPTVTASSPRKACGSCKRDEENGEWKIENGELRLPLGCYCPTPVRLPVLPFYFFLFTFPSSLSLC